MGSCRGSCFADQSVDTWLSVWTRSLNPIVWPPGLLSVPPAPPWPPVTTRGRKARLKGISVYPPDLSKWDVRSHWLCWSLNEKKPEKVAAAEMMKGSRSRRTHPPPGQCDLMLKLLPWSRTVKLKYFSDIHCSFVWWCSVCRQLPKSCLLAALWVTVE